ncbi:MAG TPA: flagellar biosynthesis protein FlhA [Limnochordales bacterium]|nr:flagellar biosynthesis protein FlhA [Limnochordales bacterium]
MSSQSRPAIWEAALRHGDVTIVVAVVLILVMMVVPLPTGLIDLLLAVNISLALLVLMLTMNVRHPLDFSVFPALLLVLTLFRLALNVSTTRLILLQADAGSIIRAFGHFVVGGNYVVGFVVFLILVIIQFIVITRGAERVAEVAARFTLDAMPGKQMSIDADLNAGLITEDEARRRRQDIQREADFYGAMDGASKFVKGDAIAALVITAVNILGGFAVGVGQRGMGWGEALQRYTLLTVGDGLVSQIPALLIATATGIIITRAASEASLGRDVTGQLVAEPRIMLVAAAILLAFALLPGLPAVPFLVLSAMVGGLGLLSRQEQRVQPPPPPEPAAERRPESVLGLLHVDPMELEIGYGLIPLVDTEQGGDVLERVSMIRRQMALELGIVVPSIRIRDNMELDANAYVVRIKGVEVGRGQLMPTHYLAMDSGATAKIQGIETREPAFGLPALWIAPSERAAAEQAGYTVVDASAVLATHLTEIIRRHAADLLGRQETRTLLDKVKEEFPAVVEELVPELLSVGEVQRVLQNLLREGVPIRNLVVILEVLADAARTTRDVALLTEAVREGLAPQISQLYTGEDGVLPALTLDPALEEELREALTDGQTLAWAPPRAQRFLDRLARAYEAALTRGQSPVLLCPPGLRRPLRQLTMRSLPRLPVLAYSEVAAGVEVRAVGMVTLNGAD